MIYSVTHSHKYGYSNYLFQCNDIRIDPNSILNHEQDSKIIDLLNIDFDGSEEANETLEIYQHAEIPILKT